MGYLILFDYLGLDYTWSTYASEGGNFGLFTSDKMMKKLNAKMYAEAKRLGVKWILGGECGHMLVPAGAKAVWKRTPRPYFQTSTFSSDSRKVTAWGTPVLTLCRVMGCCSTSMVWFRRRSLGGVNSTVT